MKSRGVYETPGGTIMLEGHRAMESITLDRGEMHLKVLRNIVSTVAMRQHSHAAAVQSAQFSASIVRLLVEFALLAILKGF